MSALLSSGMQLMLIGMGTVFFFLTLLVLATGLMSRLVLRFAPLPEPSVGSATAGNAVTPELVAVVSAAVHAHRAHSDRGKTT